MNVLYIYNIYFIAPVWRVTLTVVCEGAIPTVETQNLQLGSTLMVSIYTPCQPLLN